MALLNTIDRITGRVAPADQPDNAICTLCLKKRLQVPAKVAIANVRASLGASIGPQRSALVTIFLCDRCLESSGEEESDDHSLLLRRRSL